MIEPQIACPAAESATPAIIVLMKVILLDP
jgi:hypothetical protein